MNVLVDTSVWSLALRRNDETPSPYTQELQTLIQEMRVRMIGPIRQEILSGVRHQAQFEKLRENLHAFSDLNLESADYERAAEFFNLCRRQGIQGSNTDFLICAVAERCSLTILTTDGDFEMFQQHIPISLHKPRTLN